MGQWRALGNIPSLVVCRVLIRNELHSCNPELKVHQVNWMDQPRSLQEGGARHMPFGARFEMLENCSLETLKEGAFQTQWLKQDVICHINDYIHSAIKACGAKVWSMEQSQGRRRRRERRTALGQVKKEPTVLFTDLHLGRSLRSLFVGTNVRKT